MKDLSVIYNMLCFKGCPDNDTEDCCRPGGCTCDCWYDFDCEGRVPSEKEVEDTIRAEFKRGGYVCHKQFNGSFSEFMNYVREHEDNLQELKSMCFSE